MFDDLMAGIKAKLLAGQYVTTRHFLERCDERNLDARTVVLAAANGSVIEDYPEDDRGHSCLILANSKDYVLHVLVGVAYIEIRMIIVYKPDPDIWDSDYQKRR